jgi:hypothetical protein
MNDPVTRVDVFRALILCLYLGYIYIDLYIDRIKPLLEVENIRR